MNRRRAAKSFTDRLVTSREYVRTPGGFRHTSFVHQLRVGQSIVKRQGRFALQDPERGLLEVPAPQVPAQSLAGQGGGWVAWGDWIDNGASLITSFSTSWAVPPPPATQSGQLIFLFNALEDAVGDDIIQPVLQWGVSGAGGGNYWAIASWYVDSSNHAFSTPLVQVHPGDQLTGVITLAIQADGSLNYTSQFAGIANTSLVAQGLANLAQATETLEAYGITQVTDYPNTARTAMTGIDLRIAGNAAALQWSGDVMQNPLYGEHPMVVSNANPAGEVDLFYS